MLQSQYFSPCLLNFGLLYVINVFSPFISCFSCNVWLSFMYSLYLLKSCVLDRLLLVSFLLLFFHLLCFLLVRIKFDLYFHVSCFYFITSRICILFLNSSLFWYLLKAVLINIVSLKSSDNVLLNVTWRLKSPTAGSPESLPVWIFSVPRW